MQSIKCLLLEPVGCLAEFPSAPFHEIAVRLFGRKGKASPSGSRSYWHLLNLMGEGSSSPFLKDLEIEAVNAASAYEDIVPALTELKSMGVHLSIASSLSDAAIARFVEKNSLGGFFAGVWNRENADGIKAVPLVRALRGASLQPENVMFLTDTVEGIKVARSAGVQPVLMMNDPDEARRLATYNPAGGVVSLHEIPDFIRLIAAQNKNGQRAQSR
ncbi:MAG: HAD hydrolase-like protein [Acidobacteriia bacterium]|nr:HAD hydrolase-like protein [Terriglobia bacterium]